MSVPHTGKKYTWVVKSKSGVAVNTWLDLLWK